MNVLNIIERDLNLISFDMKWTCERSDLWNQILQAFDSFKSIENPNQLHLKINKKYVLSY